MSYEPQSKSIKYYDSMHFEKCFCVQEIKEYLVMESKEVSVQLFKTGFNLIYLEIQENAGWNNY